MEESIEICIREVNENIRRVKLDMPLTRSLSELNRSCKFREKYEEIFNETHQEELDREVKAKQREYHQRPGVKAKQREYQRKKHNIPKSKWRVKE